MGLYDIAICIDKGLVVTLDKKETMYKFCENLEDLYDYFYYPLLVKYKYTEEENQELQQIIDKAYIEFYDLIYHQIGYKYDLDETDNEKIKNLLKTLKGGNND